MAQVKEPASQVLYMYDLPKSSTRTKIAVQIKDKVGILVDETSL
jgi:hypothetical protein